MRWPWPDPENGPFELVWDGPFEKYMGSKATFIAEADRLITLAQKQITKNLLEADERAYQKLKHDQEEHMGPEDKPLRPYSLQQYAVEKACEMPCRPQGVGPWIKQRVADFGDVHLTITCGESGELHRAHLNGAVHDQAELKALIGFLQELVR